ncbi:MAG: D-alanine--D-alanine ligase [Anaerolineae bacterium]|nr:D-alanine--D-alanine ligase [Anaerolineae bacterium]
MLLPRRLIILYSISHAQGKDDALGEDEVAQVAHALRAVLSPRIPDIVLAPVDDDVVAALQPYDPDETLIFNLCEAIAGDVAREAAAAAHLTARGFRFTGAPAAALALCQDKAQAKARLLAAGLPTPAYQVFHAAGEPLSPGLRFPLFVKPVAEDGSVGISQESVVTSETALRARVKYVLGTYHEPSLVEEFIGGREFNIGVWGNDPPEVLPLAELTYRNVANPLARVVTYAAKWEEDNPEYHDTPVTCPAQVDEPLAIRLRQTALAAYRVMGCRDYARVDMREREDEPYILEVNPNPSLSADAGFHKAARAAGYDYAGMAAHIVALAWARGER